MIKLPKKYLKRLIKEAYQKHAFIDALHGKFSVEDVTPAEEAPYRGYYKITKQFKICKVILFFTQYDDGHIYISDLSTVDVFGRSNENCFRKGYANQVLQDFASLADQFDIDMSLTAASLDKERFPNPDLIKFYEKHGFGGGNPNSDWVEMIRDRKSERPI